MKKNVITQLVHKYALINANTNEWLYEGGTYGACLRMVPASVPIGTEYVIVAVMKEGTYKPKNERKKTC
jgi:hypothetical protein